MTITISQLLAVLLGGAVGSVLRFILSVQIQKNTPSLFPLGIFIVNTLGCLLIGFLATVLIDRFALPTHYRAGILVGVLGGFTTFSSFTIDCWALFLSGRYLLTFLYVILTVLTTLMATGIGILLGRLL